MAGWKSTPGAIAWLRTYAGTKKRKAAPEPKGPLTAVKAWLNKRLPQEDDVWQSDFRQVPNWMEIDGERTRPWLALVTSPVRELILAHEVTGEKPTPALLWDMLVQAMQHPTMGAPHRPSELQVRPGEPWESLRSHLDEIGVRLAPTEDLRPIRGALEGLSEHLAGKGEPGLLDVPGVTPERAAAFYDAAASFFRKAPWKKVGYESAIRVECDRSRERSLVCCADGPVRLDDRPGVVRRLAALRRLWAGDFGDEENARETVGTSVTFDEESVVPVADLESANRYGWPVARSDAYPLIFHKERGLSTRPPLAWELELMEACLRTVPDFVERRGQDDPTREETTIRTAGGELTLGLSWVVDVGGEEG